MAKPPGGRPQIVPTLAALLMLLAVGALDADIVQIGTGNLVNQSLPIEAARNYSYSQQIYYNYEINYLGYITSVAFQYSVSGNLFYQNNSVLKVYLGHTARTQLMSFVPLDSLTLVYDGVVALTDFSNGLPGQGWLTITLPEPFFYDGTNHLLVAVDENAPGSSLTADEFLCSGSGVTRGIFYDSMTVNPDPAAPPATGYTLRQSYPNIRLNLTVFSYLPYEPNPSDQATGVPTDSNLQWQSNAGSFDLWLGTTPQAMTLVGQDLTQSQWNPTEPWQQLQTYYWQVIGYHQGQDYPGEIWSFTTAGAGIGAPQNLTAYFNGDHVQLAWNAPQTGVPALYRIYRNGTFLAVATDPEYQDFEVSPGQTFYYYIRAQSTQGELSAPSNTVTVHIPDLVPNLILMENFDNCEPFSQAVEGWQNLDLDASPTWNWANVNFPGEGSTLPWLVFVPAETTPPLTSVTAHSGAAMLASLSATQPPNNDLLISPRLNLGNSPSVSFWARSHTSDYGLERLRVLISTTDALPASFSVLNSGSWLSVPAVWTEYTYDLSAWQGQSVFLAWNCVSWDAFALYLDDLVITGEGGYVPLDDELAPPLAFSVYPNPSRGSFAIQNPNKALFDLALYDLRGRKLFSAANLSGFQSTDHSLNLPSGIYLLRLESGGKSLCKRLAVIK